MHNRSGRFFFGQGSSIMNCRSRSDFWGLNQMWKLHELGMVVRIFHCILVWNFLIWYFDMDYDYDIGSTNISLPTSVSELRAYSGSRTSPRAVTQNVWQRQGWHEHNHATPNRWLCVWKTPLRGLSSGSIWTDAPRCMHSCTWAGGEWPFVSATCSHGQSMSPWASRHVSCVAVLSNQRCERRPYRQCPTSFSLWSSTGHSPLRCQSLRTTQVAASVRGPGQNAGTPARGDATALE